MFSNCRLCGERRSATISKQNFILTIESFLNCLSSSATNEHQVSKIVRGRSNRCSTVWGKDFLLVNPLLFNNAIFALHSIIQGQQLQRLHECRTFFCKSLKNVLFFKRHIHATIISVLHGFERKRAYGRFFFLLPFFSVLRYTIYFSMALCK